MNFLGGIGIGFSGCLALFLLLDKKRSADHYQEKLTRRGHYMEQRQVILTSDHIPGSYTLQQNAAMLHILGMTFEEVCQFDSAILEHADSPFTTTYSEAYKALTVHTVVC